jgi:hypothetical protein
MTTRGFLLTALMAVLSILCFRARGTADSHANIPADLNRSLQRFSLQGGSGSASLDSQDDTQQQIHSYILQKEQEKRQTTQVLLLRAYQADEDTLYAALRSKSASERFAATYMVGERLLPWQGDLIDQLTDSSDTVRQAARRSLVILSFFTIRGERVAAGDLLGTAAKERQQPAVVDFGPKAGAQPEAREEAVKKWRAWWKEHGGLEKAKKPELRAARANADSDPDREAALLSAALVYAEPAQQAERLTRYRKEKGVVYTEAIAEALPQLSGPILRAARESLAERLSRMTAATLRERITDSRPEVRRAAAIAWAMKEDRAAIPELIPMLADPDDFVGRGVKAALKSLTGQDFGPGRDATPAERTAAVAVWQSWWRKQR